MRKFLNFICMGLVICLLFPLMAKAEYLEPEFIDGEDVYNLYDILEIKKGTVKDIYDTLMGKGKEFYLNKSLMRTYEDSIVYYIDGKYEAIDTVEYTSNGYSIKLPAPQTRYLSGSTLYLSTDKLTDYFGIDVESEGILYEKQEEEQNILGVDISFLKNKITSLGYVGEDTFYCYAENDLINNYVFFYDDYIVIQWYYNMSEDKVDLILKALFPESYEELQNNLFYLNGNYDNRSIKTSIQDDFLYIEISNELIEETEEETYPEDEDEILWEDIIQEEPEEVIQGYIIEEPIE